ncbi:MAG: hypothetical protein ORO03_06360, partial [Alphaproteobacteria bacterium]|nr:hypothetical protein [Alphaproteobacteria bacterium]
SHFVRLPPLDRLASQRDEDSGQQAREAVKLSLIDRKTLGRKKFGLLRRLTATAFALMRLWRGAKPRGDGITCEFSGKQRIS